MRRANSIAVALALAAAVPAVAPAAAHAQGAAIDTAAMGALNRMGAYLSTLDVFQVRAEITKEEVLTDGQKVQLASVADLVADRPSRVRVNLTSDRQERLLVYDGANFTLFAPRLRYYSTNPAPGTIHELATVLEDRYGMELPLVDLFRWGTQYAKPNEIQAAREVGPSVVEGVTCTQYVFRQEGLDWQVWIQEGDFPLPRRLVLTTTSDDARPQYQAVYSWNLAPSFNEGAFAFVPPDGAKQITLAEVMANRTAANR